MRTTAFISTLFLTSAVLGLPAPKNKDNSQDIEDATPMSIGARDLPVVDSSTDFLAPVTDTVNKLVDPVKSELSPVGGTVTSTVDETTDELPTTDVPVVGDAVEKIEKRFDTATTVIKELEGVSKDLPIVPKIGTVVRGLPALDVADITNTVEGTTSGLDITKELPSVPEVGKIARGLPALDASDITSTVENTVSGLDVTKELPSIPEVGSVARGLPSLDATELTNTVESTVSDLDITKELPSVPAAGSIARGLPSLQDASSVESTVDDVIATADKSIPALPAVGKVGLRRGLDLTTVTSTLNGVDANSYLTTVESSVSDLDLATLESLLDQGIAILENLLSSVTNELPAKRDITLTLDNLLAQTLGQVNGIVSAVKIIVGALESSGEKFLSVDEVQSDLKQVETLAQQIIKTVESSADISSVSSEIVSSLSGLTSEIESVL